MKAHITASSLGEGTVTSQLSIVNIKINLRPKSSFLEKVLTHCVIFRAVVAHLYDPSTWDA